MSALIPSLSAMGIVVVSLLISLIFGFGFGFADDNEAVVLELSDLFFSELSGLG